MTLAQATPADVEELLPLVRAYHDFEGIHSTDSNRRRALRPLLEEDSKVGRVWWIVEAGKRVGYLVLCFGYSIELGGRDAFLDELFVVPAARGRGLGTAALEAVQAKAADLGVLALHLEVAVDNPRARALYRKAGFVARERFHLMTFTPHPRR